MIRPTKLSEALFKCCGDVHHSGATMSNSTRGSIGDTQLAKSSIVQQYITNLFHLQKVTR
jgi:hypothetical protein